MGKRVFVAGATGVIGRRMVPLLVSAGYDVTGLARTDDGAAQLEAAGAEFRVADVFDPNGLRAALESASPEVIINQLTDLSNGFEPDQIAETLTRNARIREVGTANLIAAALEAGAKRFIAQSLAFIYARGRLPYRETAPLDETRGGPFEETVRAVQSLEQQVRSMFPDNHVILRYGNLYGPGSGHDGPYGPSPIHVDAAAFAALQAVRLGSGTYNIADDGGEATSAKAKDELAWDPGFRVRASE